MSNRPGSLYILRSHLLQANLEMGLTASPSNLCRFYQYWVGKLTEVTYQDTKKEQENKDALASFLPCSFVSVAYIIYLLR